MTSVVTFTALLFLFMFTFAVLGMNLFGGKLILPSSNCTKETVRSNFDTFPAAMVTIFQVKTIDHHWLDLRVQCRLCSAQCRYVFYNKLSWFVSKLREKRYFKRGGSV